MLDMAPYYITDLVNLLGPVAQVSGYRHRCRGQRARSPRSRAAGEAIPVEVPDPRRRRDGSSSRARSCRSSMSFDVPAHRHLPIEIYGTKGTLVVPDPNWFGGEIEFAAEKDKWEKLKTELPYADANYRSIGLADMAHAIRSEPPAPGERRAGAACARGDGGVWPLFGARARRRHHRRGRSGRRRSQKAWCGASSRPDTKQSGEEECGKRSSSGAAGAATSRSSARRSSPTCSKATASRSRWRTRPRPSPTLRSRI